MHSNPAVNPTQQKAKNPWDMIEDETAKSYAAFLVFRDIGPDRTLRKAAEKVSKSEPMLARWSKRFNWHHRAADWDQFNDQQMQRELFTRRARARKRALDIADKLDQKLVDAVELLQVQKVITKGTDGKPDVVEGVITPTELARLFEVSQNIQHRILGKDEDEGKHEYHLHFDAPDPEREFEQPEAVLAARKKAQQEKHQQVQGEQEAM